ncbi:MAG: hypothetical protein ACWGQW_13075 [bacterium]
MSKHYAATPIRRMNLKQLVFATNARHPDIIKRANQQCHTLRKEYNIGSRDGFKRVYRPDRIFYNEVRLYSACTDGKRISYVRFFGPPDPTTPAWVWCSCPYFTFNLEVCLTRYNSSSILLSNGQLPIVRNRQMFPHLCKHLVNTAKFALEQKDDLAARRMEAMQEAKTAAAKQQLTRMAQKPTGQRIPPRRFVSPDRGGDLVDLP